MRGIDTNLLVYAFDTAYPQKWAVCRRLLQEAFAGESILVVTNQILAEFAVVVTKKIGMPLSSAEAISIIRSIQTSNGWKVLYYNEDSIVQALEGKSFWDALIASTLKQNGVDEFLTENVDDFKGLGIKVTNPLK